MKAVADLVDERSLRSLAGAPTYLEGATCAEHHCARITESTDMRVVARVDDMETYDTTLTAEGDRLRWSCTCGQVTAQRPCKHVVAVGVTIWRQSPPRKDQPDDVSKGRGLGLSPDQGTGISTCTSAELAGRPSDTRAR
jgi:uncharacterized Zn finger protein